ncbi:MAG: zinc ribbon domain-containing protein [Pirellulaceae bacterium]|nr:zinc ribbon domain-containing protein [Pirellulaceae bacterium]
MNFDDANKPLEDYEYPEPDVDDDTEAETVPCSHCGEPIYEEAVECPYCGNYVQASTSVWSGRPIWWLIIGGIGVAAVIYTLSLAR